MPSLPPASHLQRPRRRKPRSRSTRSLVRQPPRRRADQGKPRRGQCARTLDGSGQSDGHAADGDELPHALPAKNIGVPIRAGTGIQEQVTEVGRTAAGFHNNWLLLLCFVICAVVLALLGYTIVRFRRGANPTPSRTSHNTALEVVWTLVPVLILVAIAVPSFRLLRTQYTPPPADLTVKVTGNQWFWVYSYPDNGGFEVVSNLLKEQKDVKPGDRSAPTPMARRCSPSTSVWSFPPARS